MPRTNQLQFVGLLKDSAHLFLRSGRYLTLYQKEFFEN